MPWKNWSAERLGIALAVLAAFGFSFKAIFVKLAYAAGLERLILFVYPTHPNGDDRRSLCVRLGPVLCALQCRRRGCHSPPWRHPFCGTLHRRIDRRHAASLPDHAAAFCPDSAHTCLSVWCGDGTLLNGASGVLAVGRDPPDWCWLASCW